MNTTTREGARAPATLPTGNEPRPAIPAAKNPILDELLYRCFARWSLWRYFDRVWLQSHGPLPHPRNGPLIVYMNHSSWWDGYLMYVIHRMVLRGRFDAHLLMEEKQLRRYRFFRWSGAFSVNRDDPEDAWRSQAYAAALLRGGRQPRLLFIFPQGKIVPNDRRPLVTYPGIARIIAQVGNVNLCPVALRYELLGRQFPEAFIRIGPCYRAANPSDLEGVLADITRRLTDACDALREDVLALRYERFQPLLRGRRGIDELFDGLLSLLPGQSHPRRT